MKRIIYGAGKYGNLLLDCYRNLGLEIDFFAQTQKPAEDEMNGVKVITFDELLKIQDEMEIMLSIQNTKTCSEIKKMFSKTERNDIEVFDMSSFINDNLLGIMKKTKHFIGGRKYCIICNSNIDRFRAAGRKQEIFEKYHIIGGGYRENDICPLCESGDRERWLYYIVKNKTNIENMSGRILHFAPEKSISEFIKTNSGIDYYTGDIVAGRAMHVTDITNIQYKNETFDYVICNHVMEHIPDEAKAVEEVKRVLKKNGKWICSFPICTDIETLEDKSITGPEDRLREYGQEDHVRLYGRDYKERYEKYGLKICFFSPRDELENEDIEKYGFIEDDIIMIAEKLN